MPRTRRRLKRRGGYTLLEIMVSVLLTSIMVTSVLTVALTARQGGGRVDRKMVASQASRELQARLKNYVRDPTGNTAGIPGPGTGANPWSMDSPPVDDLGGAPFGACTDCDAMTVGTHTVRGILPGWFEAAPYNATIKYIVFAGSPPRIEFAVTWTEP